jgi:hypothetical protein
MRCPSCGFENPEGLKFCNECGAPFGVCCPQCGLANQPRAKFCGECGTPLRSRSPASTAPPLTSCPHAPLSYTPAHLAEKILYTYTKSAFEGERKQVTVLFADLKGSMELLADRDPEEARAILDPVLECMMEAVQRYEGTVNQVMGDGILALFGAPIAHEDHAVRACYAALAMQEVIRRYSEDMRRTHQADRPHRRQSLLSEGERAHSGGDRRAGRGAGRLSARQTPRQPAGAPHSTGDTGRAHRPPAV